MKWPYDDARAHEHPGNLGPITPKQIWYINKLSAENDDHDETLNAIMDSIDPNLDIEDLIKGQAMYVIACLLGDIKPVEAP